MFLYLAGLAFVGAAVHALLHASREHFPARVVELILIYGGRKLVSTLVKFDPSCDSYSFYTKKELKL